MNRKPFTPQQCAGYRNQGGGVFDCIGTPDPEKGGAVLMQNRASKWTFYAHGIGIYEDDSIDWDYSTEGHFAEAEDRKENQNMKTGMFDKNGTPIEIGDKTRLVLESGEVREFDVCFKKVTRMVKNHPDFVEGYSRVEITGVVFCWEGYDLFPCVDKEGISDVSKMEVIKKNENQSVKMIEFLGESVPVELCTVDRFGEADDFVGCGYCFEGSEAAGIDEVNCDNCTVNRIFGEYARLTGQSE